MAHSIESSGFAEFDRLNALFGRTRALLEEALVTGGLPEEGSDVLANETLPHIEDVEAGFRAWLRAGEAGTAELRSLILQGGLGPPRPRDPAEARAALIEQMQARSGAAGSRIVDHDSGARLAALEHARLVFAVLPRTAATDVRFPRGRRSYADIVSPRTPAELAMRIEELERRLWALASGEVPRGTDEGYRRTYGFFDAAERLSSEGFHLAG